MKPIWTSRLPNAASASRIAEQSASVVAIGFSQKTGLPARIAAITYVACVSPHDVTITASTSFAAMSSSPVGYALAPEILAATSFARAASASLTATILAPASVSVSRRMCSCPIFPTPTTPTFSVMNLLPRGSRPPITDRQRPPLAQIRRALKRAVWSPHNRIGRAHGVMDNHLMAHRLEQADGVGRHAALDAQLVRPELVVGARGILGFSDVEAVIDHIENDLQHSGDDGGAAGAAGRHQELAVLEYERRTHG